MNKSMGGHEMWAEVAYEYTFSSSSIHTPATVLWEPEEGE